MKTKLSVFAEKIIEAGWLVAVVAVPLFFNIYSARTFEPDKITLLRSVVSVMIVAWLISLNEQSRDKSGEAQIPFGERLRCWLRLPLFLPTLLLVLIYIISTIFSLSPAVSLWGSYQRLQGTYSTLSYIVIFALMAGHLRTRQQVDRLVSTIIITSIPISLYGIVQRYGLDPLPWAGDVTTRVAANMGNAIFVASYLIMVVPLTLSRLIESMTAILKEEEASWGHTVLSAVYIFALAVQLLTIHFSQSRGPMLGLMAAFFVIGLLTVLTLRQFQPDRSRLSLTELARGFVFVGPLVLAAALCGAIGYLAGWGLEKLLLALNYEIGGVPLIGAALGGGLGFFGLYTYMASAQKGWRWLWVSWFSLGVLGIGLALLLNLRNTGLDPLLNPMRELPILDRLSQVTGTESGTGKVRVLIWDAAMKLVAPHEPLGIAGDEVVPPDKFNLLRPLIGYGPEAMFNAFAYVYPAELAHVEARGSSADRSHNETMDSLVITGLAGFLAFYFLMVSLFYYALRWLGWAPDKAARRRLVILLTLGGLGGAILAYVGAGGLTFVPLGLPVGVVAGLIIHLVWQGLVGLPNGAGAAAETVEEAAAPESAAPPEPRAGLIPAEYHLLLIGLLGAIIGHFIEVHFVFSIAATYTYFWTYAGLLVALAMMSQPAIGFVPKSQLVGAAAAAEVGASSSLQAGVESNPDREEAEFLERGRRRARKGKGRQVARKKKATASAASPAAGVRDDSWEVWVGGQGFAMAIILIILTFDFITPRFQFQFGDKNSMSLLWMFVITYLVGLAITVSEVAIYRDRWGGGQVAWWRAVMLFVITSFSYFFFYNLAHRMQFNRQITVTSLDDVIRAADVLAYGLVTFYIFLLLLMMLLALTLAWRQMARLPLWRADLINVLLYPVLILAMVTVVWFKNINVVRADIYLKEGDRYRNSGQWQQAIALHQKASAIDADEDFYYLMLALDYQLMAQDQNLDPAQRQLAWQEGERIALEARRVNPYNPDNTGNMGRYYFTLGQAANRERLGEALDYFRKAITLAPSNVVYHNLLAQTHYILQDYEAAVDRLQTSVAIDAQYAPTWLLLGDTYAAMGNVDAALEAHRQSMTLGNDFFDQFLDQRLNFYISAGRLAELSAAIQQIAQARATDPTLPWAIGHAYNLSGQPEQAVRYFEQARSLGDGSDRLTRALANTYLALENFDQALPNYQRLLEFNPNDAEAHSALAFIYARQGRLAEAIAENQLVLQLLPNDYDSLKNLAILYQQQGQWQEALAAARQAQAVAPESEQFIADLEQQIAATGQ